MKRLIRNLKSICVGVACFCLLIVMKIVILTVPFKTTMQLISNSQVETSDELNSRNQLRALRVGRMLEKAGARVPWSCKCFDRALAGSVLLRVLGIPSTIYFGLRKNEAGIIEAHAWLRAGRLYVTGAGCIEQFSTVYIGGYQTKQR